MRPSPQESPVAKPETKENGAQIVSASTARATTRTPTQQEDEKMLFLPHNLRFPLKLHFVLEQATQQGYEHIVSWLPDGKSFRIHDRAAFQQHIMPTYFPAMGVYKSFQRQLSLYGIHQQFKKQMAGPPFDLTFEGDKHNRDAYSHPLLIRGDRSLCYGIDRTRKPNRKRKRITPPLGAKEVQDSSSIETCSNWDGRDNHKIESLTSAHKLHSEGMGTTVVESSLLLLPGSQLDDGTEATKTSQLGKIPLRDILLPSSSRETGHLHDEYDTITLSTSLLSPLSTIEGSDTSSTSSSEQTEEQQIPAVTQDKDTPASSYSVLASIDLPALEPLPADYVFCLPENQRLHTGILTNRNISLEQRLLLSVITTTTHQSKNKREDKSSMDIEDEIILTFR